MFTQELGGGEIDEIQQIVREVGRVTGFAPIVQHAQRHRAIAVQARIGVGIAQVDIGLVVLPADLAETLVDTACGIVAPAGFVEILRGGKIIPGAGLPATLRLD